MDCFIAEYGRGRLRSFVFNPNSISDMIPADMVVNAIIVSMVAHSNRNSELTIYHLGSSLRNPFTYSDLRDISFRYFYMHPWINKDGNPVKVDQKIKVWESMTSFNIYIAVCYLLPLKAINLLSAVTNQKFTALNHKVKQVMRFLELYKAYLFFNGIFDDRNIERLQENTRLEFADAEAFTFDSKTLNWEDYMMNTHIGGPVKYSIKK